MPKAGKMPRSNSHSLLQGILLSTTLHILPCKQSIYGSDLRFTFNRSSFTAVLLSIFRWCYLQNIPESSRKLTLVLITYFVCNLSYSSLRLPKQDGCA